MSKVVKTKNRADLMSSPKWLIFIIVLLSTFFIFIIAQYGAILLLSLYAAIRQWNVARANNWINNSITAQFIYILVAESFTVGLVYLSLKFIKRNLTNIGFKKPHIKYVAYSLIAYPVYLALFVGMLFVIQHLTHININQSQNIGFNSVHGTYQLILTFISLVILPPIAEEILFRGYLFEGLKKTMPVVAAAILTSLLFASAHLPEGGSSGPLWIGAIDTFTLSLVLTFLKQKTKNLWSGIFLHALKNAIAFVSLFILAAR